MNCKGGNSERGHSVGSHSQSRDSRGRDSEGRKPLHSDSPQTEILKPGSPKSEIPKTGILKAGTPKPAIPTIGNAGHLKVTHPRVSLTPTIAWSCVTGSALLQFADEFMIWAASLQKS